MVPFVFLTGSATAGQAAPPAAPTVGGRVRRRKVPRREHIALPVAPPTRQKPKTFERRYRVRPLPPIALPPLAPDVSADEIASIIAAIEAAEGDE